MRDLYEILKVSKDASDDDIKQAYRALAKKYHPDRNPGDKKAEDLFKDVSFAYGVLSDPVQRAKYGKGGGMNPFTLKTKSGVYSIERLAFSGDLADIYMGTNLNTHTSIALKVCRDPRNNDLIEAEAKTLGTIFPPAHKEEKSYRYLPKFYESLKIVDGGKHRQANVMAWLEHFYTLEQVRAAFHDKLPIEHGVWMFNRIMEALIFIHTEKKIVHGAITPEHVLAYSSGREVDPYNHGAKLVDWSYAVSLGGLVKAIAPKYEDFYPPEILNKKPVTPATDVYMAAKSIIYVLGGDPKTDTMPPHVPPYLSRFLKGCTLKGLTARPQDVLALYQEFKAHMRKYYGPKKYVPFNMPIRA